MLIFPLHFVRYRYTKTQYIAVTFHYFNQEDEIEIITAAVENFHEILFKEQKKQLNKRDEMWKRLGINIRERVYKITDDEIDLKHTGDHIYKAFVEICKKYGIDFEKVKEKCRVTTGEYSFFHFFDFS